MSSPSLANDEHTVALRLYEGLRRAKSISQKAPAPPILKTTVSNPETENKPSNPSASNAVDETLEKNYRELKAKAVNQGIVVKTLKKEGKPHETELQTLLKLKEEIEKIEKEIKNKSPRFDVEGLQNLLTRRMVVVPGFEIHGGVAGLMDLGPPGVGLKDNIVEEWKKHFIVKEGMLQVETTNITPHSVLLASGHVDRFTDLLVEELDEKGELTGEFHRADKLLESHLQGLMEKLDDDLEKDVIRKLINSADALSEEEMDQTFVKYSVVGPVTKRKLSKCKPFNLMFATSIGPSGLAKAYLRPETAQGIFVNFKRLLEYNNGKMPFASAQVGTGFRNEIAPKGGLIRVREFTMAEIEHFVHPEKKQHPRFSEVANSVILQLFTAKAQTTTFEMEWISAGQAVKEGKINNETLAYFMARSQQFFIKIGVDPKRLRFRQHLETEMAHYASDCYDAEILLDQGWLEVAGHADRACYDLEQHAKATKIELKASDKLDTPRIEKYVKLEPIKKFIGSTYKQKAALVISYLESLNEADAIAKDEELTKAGEIEVTLSNGELIKLSRDSAKLIRGEVKVSEDRYVPSVIEPSFGIGRILYSVLEHSYWVRNEQEEGATMTTGEKRDLTVLVRNVLSLKANIAPVKCGIIPHGAAFDVEHARRISLELNEHALNSMTDLSSAAIGRKYARFDEIGVPFVVTLDDQTQQDGTVTVRERDSEEQVRIPATSIVDVVQKLCYGPLSWQLAKETFPVELRPVKE